jgi:hypothetical protein
MANPYLLETIRGTAAANRLQIATLIGSLSRSVELLTVDIEHEEERAEGRTQGPPLPCWRTSGHQEPAHSIRLSARWHR